MKRTLNFTFSFKQTTPVVGLALLSLTAAAPGASAQSLLDLPLKRYPLTVAHDWATGYVFEDAHDSNLLRRWAVDQTASLGGMFGECG